MAADAAYQQLVAHSKETALLDSLQSLLEWDDVTYMPMAGSAYRGEQAAYLAGMVHRRQTAPEVGEWLAELADKDATTNPTSDAAAGIRLLRRQYDRKTRLPQRLVEELARLSVRGQQIWAEARRAANFAQFLPVLREIVTLKREQADALGHRGTRYDALLDEYEPGATTAEAAEIMDRLVAGLRPLVQAIAGASGGPEGRILERRYPIETQREFGQRAAAALGFDFSAGRLDVTAHPFCATLGPRDIRLTTRYREDDLGDGFFSILHEAGHGIYEQGLPEEHFGVPLGAAASLGIHESQSRMWENQVGRSRSFWQWLFPEAQGAFPESLGDVGLDDFYRDVNRVCPSLIRVDSDEVTYNLHIAIRFELEQAMLADSLPLAELPAAWNDLYRRYLGIVPPDDAQGVLQDVHWSAGMIGYFPTYALGNLYAAQFYQQAESDLPELASEASQGRFELLLQWLREKIHAHGSRYQAAELVQRVTGRPLSETPWIEHMTAKYREVYRL